MTDVTGTAESSADERVEVSRLIAAEPDVIFAELTDPQGHVRIDSSGMLQSADGKRVAAVGDSFVVQMDRESLGDRPLGKYSVNVIITELVPDRLIEWKIDSFGRFKPPVDHRYGYRLEPADEGTRVTSYYDWSRLPDQYRETMKFPIVPPFALKATLGILARTVEQRGTDRFSASA